jgi:hypothetical protein
LNKNNKYNEHGARCLNINYVRENKTRQKKAKANFQKAKENLLKKEQTTYLKSK